MKKRPYYVIEGWLIEYGKEYEIFDGAVFAPGSVGGPLTREVMPLKHYSNSLWSTKIDPHDIIGNVTLCYQKKGVYFKCKIPATIKAPLHTHGFLDGMRIPRIGFALKHIEKRRDDEKPIQVIERCQVSEVLLFDDDPNLDWPCRISRILKIQLFGT